MITKPLAQGDICEHKRSKVKAKKMTNFNQKVKILKTLSCRYDTET